MMKLLLPGIFLLSTVSLSQAQTSESVLPSGYYIVVAAYAPAKEAYAKRFSDSINKDGSHATYGLDSKRNLILVYVDRYSEFGESIVQMKSTRQKGRFTDAWVRVMKVGPVTEPVVTEAPKAVTPVPANPEPKEPIAEVKKEEPKSVTPVEEKKSEQPEVIVTSNPVSVVIEEKPAVEKKVEVKKDDGPPTFVNRQVTFNLYNAQDNEIVLGDIEIVDTERSRLITKVKSSDTLYMPDPKSKSGDISLISNSFGYRKVQYEVNYKDPIGDTAKHYVDLEGNYFVVHFELVRYHKGDIATLYNVYFFNDAAIMQPESKYELNRLLAMMNENKSYRIMLHGHTNGRGAGRIVTMGPSKEFFNFHAPDIKEGHGSSKELSSERAKVIREWLIANGVEESRIELKAWGGTRMLHDQNSVHARKNVRVEVEVLQE